MMIMLVTLMMHNGLNVALHIEQDPSHVGNDILGPFFDMFDVGCTSVPM